MCNFSDASDLPESYLKAMNEMIKRNCDDTTVVFLNLPIPPVDVRYLQNY
jgi:hypothetical protein